MKLIGLGLFCLLSTLVWADDATDIVDNGVEEGLPDYPELNETDFSQPWPITGAFTGAENVIVMISKVNWFQASEACAQQGLTLTSMDTQADQRLVVTDVRNSGAARTISEGLWTSGSNMANGVTWMWYATGKIFGYNNFAVKPTPSGNRCASFNPTTNKWNAELCTEKRYFICRCQEA